MRTLRLGAGSGFAGDRIEPAVELAEKGEIDVLVFECLAERTIALAQLARLADPQAGFDPLLERRMRAVLPACSARSIRIVTNMGAANPLAAARRIAAIAAGLGLRHLRIAAVTGDDVTDPIRTSDEVLPETGLAARAMANRIVSANAYLGARPIAEALAAGADIVVTGRVADPALFLGPLIHAFGWAEDDWERLGRGTAAGHLLECAGQITGGYFADPGTPQSEGLDAASLARLGFPIGIVGEDGSVTITKVAGSGGRITAATCKEQLLYEIHDPAAYLQPDVAADFSGIRVVEQAPDRIAIEGAGGRPRPDSLKVSVGYRDGYIGEGQISYAGPGAAAKARLAGAIVAERLALTGLSFEELRTDLIGINSTHGAATPPDAPEPYEVRLRVAGRTADMETAQRIGEEVETLYTNGPAGGGGVMKAARPVIAVATAFIDRTAVHPAITFVEAVS
ncbi:acyclic terpene utilization AtuA family protein [Phreatobacter sp.]|uniref:acyclic terpene utilization AtuA family protein n=1 Tax=Phreatobacter sp. TaxID=1966341 RepID=UPI003F6EA6D9